MQNTYIKLESSKRQLKIHAYNKVYILNNFHRLEIEPIDLISFLKSLTQEEMEEEVQLLKRLTAKSPSLSTETSSSNFVFSKKIKILVTELFDSNLELEKKLELYFNLYWKERISTLIPEHQTFLKNIFDDPLGESLSTQNIHDKTFYSFLDNKVITKDKYHNKFTQIIARVHEAEHAITKVTTKSISKLMVLAQESKSINLKYKKLNILHLLQDESNSIGAQWEFTSLIPQKYKNIIYKELKNNNEGSLEFSAHEIAKLTLEMSNDEKSLFIEKLKILQGYDIQFDGHYFIF